MSRVLSCWKDVTAVKFTLKWNKIKLRYIFNHGNIFVSLCFSHLQHFRNSFVDMNVKTKHKLRVFAFLHSYHSRSVLKFFSSMFQNSNSSVSIRDLNLYPFNLYLVTLSSLGYKLEGHRFKPCPSSFPFMY